MRRRIVETGSTPLIRSIRDIVAKSELMAKVPLGRTNFAPSSRLDGTRERQPGGLHLHLDAKGGCHGARLDRRKRDWYVSPAAACKKKPEPRLWRGGRSLPPLLTIVRAEDTRRFREGGAHLAALKFSRLRRKAKTGSQAEHCFGAGRV
ncbi:hypothetical protein [Ensifer sp. B1-9]|uniref:hypothetical protein n=1 Tax=Ensifer sp. B1-9 TaxID=3141455 RepID=UPI003D219F8B